PLTEAHVSSPSSDTPPTSANGQGSVPSNRRRTVNNAFHLACTDRVLEEVVAQALTRMTDLVSPYPGHKVLAFSALSPCVPYRSLSYTNGHQAISPLGDPATATSDGEVSAVSPSVLDALACSEGEAGGGEGGRRETSPVEVLEVKGMQVSGAEARMYAVQTYEAQLLLVLSQIHAARRHRPRSGPMPSHTPNGTKGAYGQDKPLSLRDATLRLGQGREELDRALADTKDTCSRLGLFTSCPKFIARPKGVRRLVRTRNKDLA
ncbi:hypothetical protein KIPB_004785, partial [Kipferlia bialata]